MSATSDPFGAFSKLELANGTEVGYYRLSALSEAGVGHLDQLPLTVKILLENALRLSGSEFVSDDDVTALAAWDPAQPLPDNEIAFMPSRVLLQDFTGVPCVVDLAAMRSAMGRAGGDVSRINPLVPVDLVIDHSVQIDAFGTQLAFQRNVDLEYERNRERYGLLRWAQQSFQDFRVVPPGTGIVHQVNLEYLAPVVGTRETAAGLVAFPDTLVGTDSHTTMINGLGVLGFGVGGIEAEAVMLGQPIYQLMPQVVGFRLSGKLQPGTTATDLVLYVTQILRKFGVVGRFVEFFGPGLSSLPLADRATISNMAPEYGATAALFPIDAETVRYLRVTGRSAERVDLVERYAMAQGMFHDPSREAIYHAVVELDLAEVKPSVAGPRRPQDRVLIEELPATFHTAFPEEFPALPDPRHKPVKVDMGSETVDVDHGSVAIAAITSCTNTSNPSVMIGAGLLARNAVQRGLDVPAFVKTSMAPGSHVVSAMLDEADLTPYLEALGFHTVGYGCTTCIGNSGPLPAPMAEAIDANKLIAAAVLSGNRNFEGRIHPQIRASFLASPPLVIAYALAGTVDVDIANDPLGLDPNGQPVYLADIWPSLEEVQETIASVLSAEMFEREYATVFEGDENWQSMPVPTGELYEWDPESTYIQEPPYFAGMTLEPLPMDDINGARVIAVLGDSVTTDHISPAGSIAKTSPAGQYLVNYDVNPIDFNSYGSRRGNHEVMVRGTFANIRLRNQLTPGQEGNWTIYFPTGEVMPIFDAAMAYQREGIPLVVIAGKEYGSGSSRDWAAKGPMLQGIKAVIAEGFERIHRSNLIGMGVLPLQFLAGQNPGSIDLVGDETLSITGLASNLAPRTRLTVQAMRPTGQHFAFEVDCRIDSSVELGYYRNGGILQTVLRRLMIESGVTANA